VIKRHSGLSTASMTLGIVGATFFFVPVLAQVLGILAIIFGFISRSKITGSTNLKGKGMALAGIILGFFAIFFGLFLIGFLVYFKIIDINKIKI